MTAGSSAKDSKITSGRSRTSRSIAGHAAPTRVHEGILRHDRMSESMTELPRLALTKAEAAEALSMSVDPLERYVMPELRVVRRGGSC
jgi:hypothetical protein